MSLSEILKRAAQKESKMSTQTIVIKAERPKDERPKEEVIKTQEPIKQEPIKL